MGSGTQNTYGFGAPELMMFSQTQQQQQPPTRLLLNLCNTKPFNYYYFFHAPSRNSLCIEYSLRLLFYFHYFSIFHCLFSWQDMQTTPSAMLPTSLHPCTSLLHTIKMPLMLPTLAQLVRRSLFLGPFFKYTFKLSRISLLFYFCDWVAHELVAFLTHPM
jgi:hypothetical protein